MDSTKIEVINHSFDELVKKLTEAHSNSVWDTLTPLLIGAGFTLATQLLVELWKSHKDIKRKKQELISKGRAKTYLIAQILKDLAMYKGHKQYYIRASQISATKEQKDDSYKKHYEKGQEQRVTETKLDDSIAEYFQLVTEYTIITGNKDHFQEHFEKVFEYDHPKASKFQNCNTINELVDELGNEESRLNNEYAIFRRIFEDIQAAM